MFLDVWPEDALHVVDLVLGEERLDRLGEGHHGDRAGVVAEEQDALALGVALIVAVVNARRNVAEPESPTKKIINLEIEIFGETDLYSS